MQHHPRRLPFFALGLVLLSSGPAAADVTLVVTTQVGTLTVAAHTETTQAGNVRITRHVPGETVGGGQSTVSRLRLKGTRVRVDSLAPAEGPAFVIDVAEGTVVQLNASARVVYRTSLSRWIESLARPEVKAVKLKPTGRMRSVAGVDCREWEGSKGFGMLKEKVGACIQESTAVAELRSLLPTLQAFAPELVRAAAASVKGFPLATQYDMLSISTRTTIESLTVEPIADEIFGIPADYQEKAWPATTRQGPGASDDRRR